MLNSHSKCGLQYYSRWTLRGLLDMTRNRLLVTSEVVLRCAEAVHGILMPQKASERCFQFLMLSDLSISLLRSFCSNWVFSHLKKQLVEIMNESLKSNALLCWGQEQQKNIKRAPRDQANGPSGPQWPHQMPQGAHTTQDTCYEHEQGSPRTPILTCVWPLNSFTGSPGFPVLKAKVQRA